MIPVRIISLASIYLENESKTLSLTKSQQKILFLCALLVCYLSVFVSLCLLLALFEQIQNILLNQ